MSPAPSVGPVAEVSAHGLNEELTILVISVSEALDMLPEKDPARALLIEAQNAAQRMAWKLSMLRNFAVRRGARPTPAQMEDLLIGN